MICSKYRPFSRLCLAVVCLLVAGSYIGQVTIAEEAEEKPTKKKSSSKAADKEKTAVNFVRVPYRGIQPQTAVDAEGVLHLVYLRDDPGAANVAYIRKGPGDREFSKPLVVNSQPGSAIAIGSIRGAQLAVGKGGRVHVVWNGSGTAEPRGPKKYDSPLLYTRLADDEHAFESQRAMNGDLWNLDGGSSVAADLDGRVYVVWHAGDGTGEENRRVYTLSSTDEGKTFAPAAVADTQKNGVCGCCGLKAFADREGMLYILYRGAKGKVNRDMFLLTSLNHGESFDSLKTDAWSIATCPMSSEAFVDSGDAVFAAWETEAQINVTRIDKKGREPAKPASPTGNPKNRKHPAMATNGKGETLVVWTEGTGWEKGGGLAWQIFNDKGRPTNARGKVDEAIPVWSFAAVYVEADDSFVIMH